MIARRDVLQIVDGMTRRWIGQSVLALGDKDGPGGVNFGDKRGQPFSAGHFIPLNEIDDGRYYVDTWNPRSRRIGSGEFALSSRASGGQVTLREGQRLVRLAKERLKLGLLTGKVGKESFKRAKNTYRSWQAREIARKNADAAAEWAEEALFLANTQPRRTEKRFKRLTTTRDRKTLPYWHEGVAEGEASATFFEFGGKGGAFRFPVGRPPLTEAQWVLRYMNRRGLQESDVEAPPTKYGRPIRPL